MEMENLILYWGKISEYFNLKDSSISFTLEQWCWKIYGGQTSEDFKKSLELILRFAGFSLKKMVFTWSIMKKGVQAKVAETFLGTTWNYCLPGILRLNMEEIKDFQCCWNLSNQWSSEVKFEGNLGASGRSKAVFFEDVLHPGSKIRSIIIYMLFFALYLRSIMRLTGL